MPIPGPSARIGAAGAALIAASALALAGAPAAGAHGHLTPVTKASDAVRWGGIDRFGPKSFCERYPKACELTYEEPELIPIPDPGPYRFADLLISVPEFGVGHVDLAQGEVAGLALGGR